MISITLILLLLLLMITTLGDALVYMAFLNTPQLAYFW